jgi:hypothetical protein
MTAGNRLVRRRGFAPRESRIFCRCELCRLRFGRMLYPKAGGEPLGFGRIKGFTGNFTRARAMSARHRSEE